MSIRPRPAAGRRTTAPRRRAPSPAKPTTSQPRASSTSWRPDRTRPWSWATHRRRHRDTRRDQGDVGAVRRTGRRESSGSRAGRHIPPAGRPAPPRPGSPSRGPSGPRPAEHGWRAADEQPVAGGADLEPRRTVGVLQRVGQRLLHHAEARHVDASPAVARQGAEVRLHDRGRAGRRAQSPHRPGRVPDAGRLVGSGADQAEPRYPRARDDRFSATVCSTAAACAGTPAARAQPQPPITALSECAIRAQLARDPVTFVADGRSRISSCWRASCSDGTASLR